MKALSLCSFLTVILILSAGCGSDQSKPPTGWYYVGSKIKDDDAPGGFGPCDNFPRKCPDDGPGKEGELSLLVHPNQLIDFRGEKAIRLHLLNRTKEIKAFSACDSRLYIVQEALDAQGQWQPLERFPYTDCGNSFHRVFLEPNQYWEMFAQPREGSFRTKLRFRLEPGGEQGIAASGETIYSNEYEGSIDPAALVPAE